MVIHLKYNHWFRFRVSLYVIQYDLATCFCLNTFPGHRRKDFEMNLLLKSQWIGTIGILKNTIFCQRVQRSPSSLRVGFFFRSVIGSLILLKWPPWTDQCLAQSIWNFFAWRLCFLLIVYIPLSSRKQLVMNIENKNRLQVTDCFSFSKRDD